MFKLIVVFVCCLFIKVESGAFVPEGRIVGGVPVAEGAIPYQASLRNNYNYPFCGGAVVGKRWILTAAHCTTGRSPHDVKVVVGTNNVNTGGDSYPVEAIINHEGYTSVWNGNDISLVKTSSDMKFSSAVRAIKLPTSDTGAGVTLIASGWGRTALAGERSPDLMMVDLISLSIEKCRKEFSGKNQIFDSQMCTLTKPGEGTCKGDSGGPLADNKSIVGVVSWGIPCAVGSPDVFTRVYYYMDWIQEKMSH